MGFRKFYTDDASHLKLWFVHIVEDSYQSEINVVETMVNRLSGYQGGSFGIIFYFQDSDNFYMVRINTEGKYKISKYEDGDQTTLINWTESESLNEGYALVNKLKVDYLGNGSFEYYLNDRKEGVFTDHSFTEGYSGYYAWVSENDKLPRNPVDLRYRQLQPSHDP